MGSKRFDLEERLLKFSVRVIKVVEKLPPTKAGNHVGKQLLRAGTSPYSNHGEAESAESRRDFIHKLRISLKELRESKRWLRLIQEVPLISPPKRLQPLVKETDELIRIFVVSVRTAQANERRGPIRPRARASLPKQQ